MCDFIFCSELTNYYSTSLASHSCTMDSLLSFFQATEFRRVRENRRETLKPHRFSVALIKKLFQIINKQINFINRIKRMQHNSQTLGIFWNRRI